MKITSACSRVAELAIEHHNEHAIVAHCIAFIEMLGVNTSNLRSFLRILKRTPKIVDNDESMQKSDLISSLNSEIHFENPQNKETTKDVEALKIYMDQVSADAPLACFEEIADKSDWFKMILVSQYLNCSLESVIRIADKIKDKYVVNNLKQALFFNLQPDARKKCSFSRRRDSIAMSEVNLFENVLFERKLIGFY